MFVPTRRAEVQRACLVEVLIGVIEVLIGC
jgi:hypothetical protein